MFLHGPPQGGPYHYHENLTIIPKPFGNLGKLKDFIVRSCASPWLAGIGPWLPSWIPRGPPSKTFIKPYVFKVPPWEFQWQPESPGCGPYRSHENLTIISKPFKHLGKVSDFT